MKDRHVAVCDIGSSGMVKVMTIQTVTHSEFWGRYEDYLHLAESTPEPGESVAVETLKKFSKLLSEFGTVSIDGWGDVDFSLSVYRAKEHELEVVADPDVTIGVELLEAAQAFLKQLSWPLLCLFQTGLMYYACTKEPVALAAPMISD